MIQKKLRIKHNQRVDLVDANFFMDAIFNIDSVADDLLEIEVLFSVG